MAYHPLVTSALLAGALAVAGLAAAAEPPEAPSSAVEQDPLLKPAPVRPKKPAAADRQPLTDEKKHEKKKDDRVQQDPLLKSLESPAKAPRADTPAEDRAVEKQDSQVQQDPLLRNVEPADRRKTK